MSILRFYREDTKTVISVGTELAHSNGGTTIFLHKDDQGATYYADAVLRHAQGCLVAAMQRIRQDAYNQGWRDAKAKKHGKETWFDGSLP